MLGSEKEALAPAQSLGRTEPKPARTPEARLIRIGFIPLLDIAVLVAAAELGFAEREGLRLELIKDVSWANIRDRLAFHQFDVAHMLAPMTVASYLGAGSNPSPAFAPFSLSRGGNAITLSVGLFREMQEAAGLDGSEGALANGRALKLVLEARKAVGRKPPVFAMTYPFSSHNYEFRFWMGAAGIHPDRDVTMTVVPPPLTADAMAAGAIEGFCVNAPWNLIAVDRGVGRVVAIKADIWPSAPEKVLGVRPAWAEENPEALSRLLVALDRAARWCDVPENRPALASLLAQPHYVGGREDLIRELLTDRFPVDPNGKVRPVPKYLTFHRNAGTFPWKSEALWIYSQMVRWGQVAYSEEGALRAAEAYRPDRYRAALSRSESPLPLEDSKIEGGSVATVIATTRALLALEPAPFLDGRTFDPEHIADYIDGFDIATPAPGSNWPE